MCRKYLIFFIMLFFALNFGFSQKVITNRSLRKYHHKKKKKNVNRKNKGKSKASSSESGNLFEKNMFFKSTKDANSTLFEEKIVKEMNELELLKKKYLKEYEKWWELDREITEKKSRGESVPSWLLDKRDREHKKLESILERERDLEDQIARDLKKAKELGLLKDESILKQYKTKEEMEEKERKDMELQ